MTDQLKKSALHDLLANLSINKPVRMIEGHYSKHNSHTIVHKYGKKFNVIENIFTPIDKRHSHVIMGREYVEVV